MISGKYVRVDDVIKLINTSNRGSCDYFIVDQIEELCSSEKIYDVDKVVEQLETEDSKIEIQYENNYEKGLSDGIGKAIEIVKAGGIDG